jgi:hypothetical protein
MKKIGLLVSMLLLAVVPAMARVDDGRTSQCWSFAEQTGPFGILPSQSDNLYGTPVAMIADLSGGQGVQWNQGGWWYGPEFKIILDIPNQQIPNPYKLVWIDLVYQGDVTFSWVADIVSGTHFTKIDEQLGQTGTGWKTLHQVWKFEPNPRGEIVVIGLKQALGASAAIDSICVATWCVPEPTTMAILGLGAVLSLGLRKRI